MLQLEITVRKKHFEKVRDFIKEKRPNAVETSMENTELFCLCDKEG